MITRPNQYCGSCGQQLFLDDRSCTRCGMPLADSGTDLDYTFQSTQMAPMMPNRTKPLPLGKIVLVQGIAIALLFILVLVLLVHSFGGGNLPFQSNSSTPGLAQPTPTPAGPRLLYQADWSNNLDGWTGTSDWQIHNGHLVNAGNQAIHNLAAPTIVVPYDLSQVTDYAVEAQIQVTKTVNAAGFGFFVRYDNNGHGYIAGASSPQTGPTSVFEITTANGWHSPLQQINFTPGKDWHTYRVEVQQAHIRVFIDGGLALDVEDASYPSGEFAGLWDSNAQLTISSFVIKSL
jgi:hypothetical protein